MKSSKKKANKMRGPPPNATKYTGPARVSWGRDDEVMATMVTTAAVQITTAGGTGVWNPVTNSNDVTIHPDFGFLAELYEEYRVCAVECRFFPKVKGADPSAAGGGSGTEQLTPYVMAPWRENGTPMPTFQEACQVGGSKMVSANWDIRKTIKADELDEMQFTDTNSTIPNDYQYGIKHFLYVASGPAAADVQFGFLVQYFTVQFRTRRPIAAMAARLAAASAAERKVAADQQAQSVNQQAPAEPPKKDKLAEVIEPQTQWLVVQAPAAVQAAMAALPAPASRIQYTPK
jgi:hypothetical protein